MKPLFALIASTLALAAAPVAAHFPWLAVDSEEKAVYFFGETPFDRTYKLPPAISDATVSVVDGKSSIQDLQFEAVETDELVGFKSKSSVSGANLLTSQVTYGVYHGSRLEYYTQHCVGKLPTSRDELVSAAKQLDLNAEVIKTDSGIDVFVRWKGLALSDTEVTFVGAENQKTKPTKTDSTGKVSFADSLVAKGLNGIVVGHTVADVSGSIGEQSYSSVSHYLTVTFNGSRPAERVVRPKVSVNADVYPAIPEMVTSFGAAITGDSLYLYGGHRGRAHEYYSEAQGNTLWRLSLQNPKAWESLGTGPGLQGLAMVSHDGKLYRIGGFTAKNQEGSEEDLWSQANIAQYDPATKQWSELPPLPEPRSSFDAVVHQDKLYVIGGWAMQGGQDASWHDTAYVLDLSQPSLQWKRLPDPPFQRRALSVAAIDGKVYAIGGMQKSGGPSTRVDIFDTESQAWSRGPDLNGEPMDGFGSSSFATGGHLYVTTYSGLLQRLSSDGKSWVTLKGLPRDRFFHRLLPISDNKLLAVGGASMSSGKFKQLDVIEIK